MNCHVKEKYCEELEHCGKSEYHRKLEYEKQCELVDNLKRELEKQEKKKKQLKLEYKHPYINALCEFIHLDIVRICIDYVYEKFCGECGEFYYGSICLTCNKEKFETFHITCGDIKRVYCKAFNYWNYNCYVPAHVDDIQIFKYWSKYSFQVCKHHTNFGCNSEIIPKGSKLIFVRNGQIVSIHYKKDI